VRIFKVILTLTALLMVSGCIAVPVGPGYGPGVSFGFYGGGGGHGGGHGGGYGGGYRR
jgi:hypothetical protein